MDALEKYLQVRSEEIVAGYAKRVNASGAYASEVANFLLKLTPELRVLMVDAINLADRQVTDDKIRMANATLRRLDYADGISSTLKTERVEAEG